MSKLVSHLYEFGEFQLDVTNSSLMSDGEIIPLKPKVFDTLLALVENRGTVLSKTELMKRLWPETIVEENNLTQNISALRKVFAAKGQNYIETIPKRGYRFVAEVNEVYKEEVALTNERPLSKSIIVEQQEEEAPQPSPPVNNLSTVIDKPASTVSVSRRPKWKLIVTLGALLLIVITGATWWKISYSKIRFNPTNVRYIGLADWKGEQGDVGPNGTLSPDGSMIAYSRIKNGYRNIWLQTVTGSEPRPVTVGDWNDTYPIWSPDSQELAYLSVRGDKPAIYRIPFLGGSPLLVTKMDGYCRALVGWIGQKIYYQEGNNLVSFDLESSETVRLTNFPADPLVMHIRLSPDEKKIAYMEIAKEESKIFIKNLADDSLIKLPDEPDRDKLLWLPDGSGLLYNANRNGFYQICVAYLSGETQQLTSGNMDFAVQDISSDGSKILYSSTIDEADLWRVSVDKPGDEHFTFDIKSDLWPAVSPDGHLLAFQQTDGLWKFFYSSILLMPTDSSSDPRIIVRNGFEAKWSPDGREIAFLRMIENTTNLWIVDRAGLNERQVSKDELWIQGFGSMPHFRIGYRYYSWSPDGKYLAYCAKPMGHWNMCVFSLDAWTQTTITNNTDNNVRFVAPLWSPNGRYLAYVAYQRGPLQSVLYTLHVMEGTSQKASLKQDSSTNLLGWSQSGNEPIIAIVKQGNPLTKPLTGMRHVTIFQVSLSGEKTKLCELENVYANNIQLSPDRKSIAFAGRQEGKDNIWVMPFGGTPRKITNNTDPYLYFSSLEWAPDQKTIYYGRQQRKNQIALIDTFR